ncbi:MAG: DNA protecting protein DprA [Candidatus Cloacimonetes bacterium 4572_55]|nr:MAG: DNA protecting protein DprA [Candidatus Cloacimonetes bacterium 4572_55]
MNEANILALLRLLSTPNVGQTRIRNLVDQFGSPEAVFHASIGELSSTPQISLILAEKILSYQDQKWVDNQLRFLDNKKIRIMTLWDAEYPDMLRAIYDPPSVLFIKGELKKEDDLSVGIVGTRRASRYGLKVASKISMELSERGLTVVSGLARGIDTAAHKAALDAGGRTIAVLGCGLDVVYPLENHKFYEDIPLHGAIISEYPMNTHPEPKNFPPRNRIISGLSQGVLVVEAPIRSGALLTANSALNQGREVFAVPGLITDKRSGGTHNLIKQGAKLVSSVDDILEELRQLPQSITQRKTMSKKNVPSLNKNEAMIYEKLGIEPKHIDLLSEELGMPPSELLVSLLQMELKSAVTQLPGKLFVVD